MGSPGFVIYTLREILIPFFGPLVSRDLDKKDWTEKERALCN